MARRFRAAGIPVGTAFQRSGQDCKVLLDNPDYRSHLTVVIGSIRHKALRRYWTRGQARGLNGEWIRKLRRIMSALEAAERPEHMSYPGSYFHALKGDRAGRYAVRLTANWRRDLRMGRRQRRGRGHRGLSSMIERHPSIEPVHPGEVLREDILPALSMSKTAVADALGISRQTLYDILNEKQPVTAEMAVRFGKLFGNGGRFWINLQRSHDLAVAERTVDVSEIRTVEARAG